MSILVAVDGSTASKSASHEAAQMAEELGMALELVHSPQREVTDNGNGELIKEGEHSADERAMALMDRYLTELQEYDVEVSTTILSSESPPVTELVNHIYDKGPKLVYIGHRALSNKEHMYLGSVSGKLVKESPVPVTVVTPDISEE